MVGEAFLAFKKGYCSYRLFSEIKDLVEKYHLPSKSDVPVNKVVKSLFFDKKSKGGKISFVLPVRIGAVKTGIEITPDEIISNWEKWL